MKSIEALLQDVESSDPGIRHAAALELMNRGDERAVAALWNAINRPENANHRGTLVYALSAFDQSEHLESLVSLALTGNFEVSMGAFTILEDCTRAPESLERIRAQLALHPAEHLTQEHHAEALEALLALLQPE
ncbi:HEAT repeat domain-containing protein [Roseateles chitinivorans]|uniref:HEAT repeat domain-containing protein n=1 Tax=Roseateles chitinivorans TaxID=2917965 RepID=UPI003D664360